MLRGENMTKIRSRSLVDNMQGEMLRGENSRMVVNHHRVGETGLSDFRPSSAQPLPYGVRGMNPAPTSFLHCSPVPHLLFKFNIH